MFLFDLTYEKPLEEVDRLLPEHILYLDKWYAGGKFLCLGRKNPRTGGVILCSCASLEEAERIRDEDPFYRQGVARYVITEFFPSKAAEGFQALLH